MLERLERLQREGEKDLEGRIMYVREVMYAIKKTKRDWKSAQFLCPPAIFFCFFRLCILHFK